MQAYDFLKEKTKGKKKSNQIALSQVFFQTRANNFQEQRSGQIFNAQDKMKRNGRVSSTLNLHIHFERGRPTRVSTTSNLK